MAAERGSPLGSRLRELRIVAGFSQEALAERAGLTAAAIGALERGDRRRPYPHTVQALADALGLDPGERASFVALAAASPTRDVALAPPTTSSGVQPPAAPSPLIGRQDDIAIVAALLLQGRARLVTLSGPGGVGKSRLAIEVLQQIESAFADGVVWVDLSSTVSPIAVIPAIGRALGADTAIKDLPQLQAALGHRRVLLAIDNFEQVVAAAADLAALLEACPALSILVTSREALRIRAEHEVQVAPLAVPVREESPSSQARAESLQLLLQRAEASGAPLRGSDGAAPVLAEICRRLDGLPLAIELAAAQLRYMAPEVLLARLDQNLDSLKDGPRDFPARHRSLRDAIAWSHELLSATERELFEELSVFRGGFTLEAACAVHGKALDESEAVLQGLWSLVDKSLLVSPRQPGLDPRFQMLDTIREYAVERLNARGDDASVRGRHAEFFASVAWDNGLFLASPRRNAALARIEAEHPNLDAAFAWAVRIHDASLALRLAGSLGFYWILRGEISEGSRWIAAALQLDTSAASSEERARASYCAAGLAWKREEHAHAADHASSAVAIARNLPSPRLLAVALALRGLIATSQAQFEIATQSHRESLTLFESLEDRWGAGYALSNLGDALLEEGDLAGARECYRQGLEEFAAASDDWGQGIVLHAMGNAAWRSGEIDAARRSYAEASDRFRSIGNHEGLGRALASLAATLLRRAAPGDLDLATGLLRESLDHWQDVGIVSGMALAVEGLGAVAAETGDVDRAAELFSVADAAREGRPPLFVVEPDLFALQRVGASKSLSEDEYREAVSRGRNQDLVSFIASFETSLS